MSAAYPPTNLETAAVAQLPPRERYVITEIGPPTMAG